jgi:hypothetical protein
MTRGVIRREKLGDAMHLALAAPIRLAWIGERDWRAKAADGRKSGTPSALRGLVNEIGGLRRRTVGSPGPHPPCADR